MLPYRALSSFRRMSIVVTFSGNVPTLTWPNTAATASLLMNFCPAYTQQVELLVLVLGKNVPDLNKFGLLFKARLWLLPPQVVDSKIRMSFSAWCSALAVGSAIKAQATFCKRCSRVSNGNCNNCILCKVVQHMHQLECDWCHRYCHAQVTFKSQTTK